MPVEQGNVNTSQCGAGAWDSTLGAEQAGGRLRVPDQPGYGVRLWEQGESAGERAGVVVHGRS